MAKKHVQGAAGQSIILIALFASVLLVFALLGIDGADEYNKRRSAQNASDQSSLAGGDAYAHGENAGPAVIENARLNGFDNTQPDVQVEWKVRETWDTARFPGAVRVYSTVRAIKQVYFPFAGFGTLPYEAMGVTVVLPKRLNAAAAGLVAGISTSCNNAARVSSGSLNFGSVWSYTDLDGSSARGVIGSTYHVGILQLSTNVATGSDTQGPPLPVYGLPQWGDWQPGGQQVVAAQAAGVPITYYADSVRFQKNDIWPTGIIVVTGDVQFVQDPPEDLVLTIITTGKVSASSKQHNWTSAWGNVLVFSTLATNCGMSAVSYSGSTTTLRGGIYAPSGGCSYSASITTDYGPVVCATIDVSGSHLDFPGTPADPPDLPITVYLGQ